MNLLPEAPPSPEFAATPNGPASAADQNRGSQSHGTPAHNLELRRASGGVLGCLLVPPTPSGRAFLRRNADLSWTRSDGNCRLQGPRQVPGSQRYLTPQQLYREPAYRSQAGRNPHNGWGKRRHGHRRTTPAG